MPMNKQLTTILKNVKDTGLSAELMGQRDIKMAIQYSHPAGVHKGRAVQVLESSHTGFRTTTKNEKAVSL